MRSAKKIIPIEANAHKSNSRFDGRIIFFSDLKRELSVNNKRRNPKIAYTCFGKLVSTQPKTPMKDVKYDLRRSVFVKVLKKTPMSSNGFCK